MSRVAKLGLASAIGGALLAVVIVSAMRPPPGPAIDPAVIELDTEINPLASELKRCRTITMPESSCDAVWEAQRERFFHPKD